MDNGEMASCLGIGKTEPMNRTALMGMLALQEALQEAGLSADGIGLISGTTVGGMDKSEQYYLDYLQNDSRNDYIKIHDCGATTELMADCLGRFAFMTTISTACSSAANAILLGANMLRSGELPCVVVGGSECLTKFHLNGFNSLMILDKDLCRPFDRSRAGLNLGEGAAYLVLENAEHAVARGVKPLAVLSGYGNACDAYHQTASSPDGDGAYRAMSAALRMAGMDASQVDYVNAHGTGTPNNDSSESAAMRRVWPGNMPPVSSTKSFTGHTTSASGAIEAAICLLAMQHRFLPPNLHFADADPDCVIPVSQLRTGVELRHVLCNSFGFGGNDTSFLLSKPEAGSKLAFLAKEGEVKVYAAKCIAAQNSLAPLCQFPSESLETPFQRAADPDFKGYMPPLEARRLGRLMKRAVVTSKEALSEAGLEMPEAILTGTGLGCIETTEFFLDSLCKEGEQLLKPTCFMQSTHNTIGSAVATQIGCHGYNVTYAHKEMSFDSALYDGVLQLRLGDIRTVLVGGHDELTLSYYKLLEKTGFLGLEGESACEASTSFVLAADGCLDARPLCVVKGIRLLYCPEERALRQAIGCLLADAGMTMSDLSGVVLSVNGNADHDAPALALCRALFADVPLLHYKHLFGESYAASGLGFYVSVACLATAKIPDALYLDPARRSHVAPKALMLFNTTDNKCCSLTLLSQVKTE